MALSSLVVRIGADVSGLHKEVGQAERIVDRFGKRVATTGRSVARIGNVASQAAGSIARLGGVMPGVSSNALKMTAVLGTAGVVFGETAVLSTALTKSWRLLTVASTHLATALPAALAPLLGNPVVLAIAAVAALTGGVLALKSAWSGAGSAAVQALSHTPKAWADQFFAGVAKGDAGRAFKEGGDSAEQTVREWTQVIEGIRPVTDKIATAWATSWDKIASALRMSGDLTREQISELYALRDALRQVASIGAPGAAGGINVGGLLPTQKQFGLGLDPRKFLGDRMDFVPTAMPKQGGFFSDVKSGLRPKDAQGNAMSLGQTVGGMVGGAAGGMVQAFAAFGPLAAILPVISGAMEVLGPVLEMLIEPLVEIGRVVGKILAPVFEMLAPVIQLIADLLIRQLAPILRVMVLAFSLTMEAVGWLVRGIGKLVDSLPGISAKGVINAGQEMIDAAKAARRNTDATENATDAINEFAGALSNIPNVLSLNALRHLIGGGGSLGAPTTPQTGPTGPGGPMGGGPPMENVIFNIYVNDATEVAERVGNVLDRRRMRGGTTRLVVATL